MTYTRYEQFRLCCNECDKIEEYSVNPEYCNPIEEEEIFLSDLFNKKGWKYTKDYRHYCPECVSNPYSEYNESV